MRITIGSLLQQFCILSALMGASLSARGADSKVPAAKSYVKEFLIAMRDKKPDALFKDFLSEQTKSSPKMTKEGMISHIQAWKETIAKTTIDFLISNATSTTYGKSWYLFQFPFSESHKGSIVLISKANTFKVQFLAVANNEVQFNKLDENVGYMYLNLDINCIKSGKSQAQCEK